MPWEHVLDRLREAVGYWIATVRPDGRPHVVPIWGVLVEGRLYLETGAPETVKTHNLAHNRQVVVHLDGLDDTVIIRGVATPNAPSKLVGELVAAEFSRKYAGYAPERDRREHGGLVLVEPDAVLAWTDMPTVTRWRFAR